MYDLQINECKAKMNKALEAFGSELARQRTGRATLSILDGVRVEYYGQMVPLNQVATLGVPEPKLITIAPWEPRLIPEIEKAVTKANLGLSSVNDGKIIRLPMPPLTAERRQEIVRFIRSRAEEARVAIRQARREVLDSFKKLHKDGKMTEDEEKKLETTIQKMTDEFTAKVDEALARKEKDLSTV